MKILHARSLATVACAATLSAGAVTRVAAAPAPAASASPAPTSAATPAGVSDPCTSLSTLVSRPSSGTASCTVKPANLLIETGYTNATTSGAGASSLVSYPQATLRVGVARNLEFDLVPESIARLSGDPRLTGTTDSAIGAKYEFGYTSKFVYGANVLYTLSTGNGPFTGNGDGLLANLNAGLTLSPALAVFATLGYNEQSAATPSIPARFHAFQPSLGLSLALPQSFAFYAEGFDQSSTGPGLGGRFGYDLGIQKDVGSRLQLDVNYYNYPGVQNGGHLHSIGFGAAYLIGS